MGEVSVYIHPTCMSSYRLVRGLNLKGLLGKVSLRNTSRGLDIMREVVVSIPWITYRGTPAATDPVSVEEVESILAKGRVNVEQKPMELFVKAVQSSSFVASQVLLHRDVSIALNRHFIEAALRSRVGGPSPETIVHELRESSQEVYESIEPLLARSLAYSYVREIMWARGLDSIDPSSIARKELVGAWLMAKASLGRVFLPNKPIIAQHTGIESIVGLLLDRGEYIVKSVREEQETIMGDTEYWRLLREYATI
ncbi:MAG: hypothetical protein LRS43_04580 [Desulfurococcales archaeon]|nr:hypothetical protein [Desulfurococcales archaeon]